MFYCNSIHFSPDSSADGYWHLGVQIWLTQLQFVTFTICVTEDAGTVKVKTGIGAKPQILHAEIESELNAYCESIGDRIVQAFSEPKSSGSRTLGFNPSA